MIDKNNIRKQIRETVERVFDEERIPNPEAPEFIKNRENFIGSHTYGEDLGDLGKMYVAYSYGEQHPLYVWVDKKEFRSLRPHEEKLTVGDTENKTEGVEAEEDGGGGIHMVNEELFGEEDESKENQDWVDSQGISHHKRKDTGLWFYNESPYYVKNKKGKIRPNRWTYKHLKDLKPNDRTQARNVLYLKKLIFDFKKKHKIKDNSHTDLEPGEK